MRHGWFRWMICGAVVASMAMLTGCGGGDGGDGTTPTSSNLPPASVAGTWQGDFTYFVSMADKSGTETVTVTIAQDGNSLSGDINGNAFTGTVNGNDLSFEAPTYNVYGLDVDMSASGTYDGTNIVNIDGTVEANAVGITLAEGEVHCDLLRRVN
jgi:hypothetical protein